MSRLMKLINELCPDGVEFVKLGEFSIIETGEQLNKSSLLTDGEYPVMNGGIEPSGYHSEFNTKANTITISQGGASAGYVNFMTTEFWAGAHCYTVIPSSELLNNKFLFYVLKNRQSSIQSSKQGAGIPGLNRKELRDLLIPIPALEVQEEIVRILDKFTELEAELEAQLEAELEERKKQYEYYRDNLLTFKEKQA